MGEVTDREFIEETHKFIVDYMNEMGMKRGEPGKVRGGLVMDYLCWSFEKHLKENDE